MRYAAGALYALAIAGGRGDWLPALMVGACAFLGTVALLFAVEHIVGDALEKEMRR